METIKEQLAVLLDKANLSEADRAACVALCADHATATVFLELLNTYGANYLKDFLENYTLKRRAFQHGDPWLLAQAWVQEEQLLIRLTQDSYA